MMVHQRQMKKKRINTRMGRMQRENVKGQGARNTDITAPPVGLRGALTVQTTVVRGWIWREMLNCCPPPSSLLFTGLWMNTLWTPKQSSVVKTGDVRKIMRIKARKRVQRWAITGNKGDKLGQNFIESGDFTSWLFCLILINFPFNTSLSCNDLALAQRPQWTSRLGSWVRTRRREAASECEGMQMLGLMVLTLLLWFLHDQEMSLNAHANPISSLFSRIVVSFCISLILKGAVQNIPNVKITMEFPWTHSRGDGAFLHVVCCRTIELHVVLPCSLLFSSSLSSSVLFSFSPPHSASRLERRNTNTNQLQEALCPQCQKAHTHTLFPPFVFPPPTYTQREHESFPCLQLPTMLHLCAPAHTAEYHGGAQWTSPSIRLIHCLQHSVSLLFSLASSSAQSRNLHHGDLTQHPRHGDFIGRQLRSSVSGGDLKKISTTSVCPPRHFVFQSLPVKLSCFHRHLKERSLVLSGKQSGGTVQGRNQISTKPPSSWQTDKLTLPHMRRRLWNGSLGKIKHRDLIGAQMGGRLDDWKIIQICQIQLPERLSG